MEIAKDEEKQIHKAKRQKGGLRTMPFIIANEAFVYVATIGLQANMIKYLTTEYNMTIFAGASILFLWSAITHFTPLLGAFLSDSYLGRFRVIVIGSFTTLLGLILLWLTTIIESARPPHCDQKYGILQGCASPDGAQMLFLILALGLMSLGVGGAKSCSVAFGADQFDNSNNPENEKTLQSYFNWYYASNGIALAISLTFMVAIQDIAGWVIGFGVPVGFMIMSSVLFLMGSSWYVKIKADSSMFSSFAQVISASWKNRHFSLSENDLSSWYCQSGSKLVRPTHKHRFLNKACITRNPENDLDDNGSAINPWNLCTVKQVEELKSLIKVLPLWSTGIMVAVTLNNRSFPLIQAETMDRPFFGKHRIPAASFSVFSMLSLILWVAIYDRILIPMIAKYTKNPRGLTNVQRMGFGIIVSCIATTIAGFVEHKRRAMAIQEGFIDIPNGQVQMSAMWLIPQHCLLGVSEALNDIGQIEFYYSQFPKTMSSVGISLWSVGAGFGNLVGNLIVLILKKATNKDGISWVSDNLNRGHYDYFYWVLSCLSILNFFYFLVVSRAYGVEDSKIWATEEVEEEEEEEVKD
ncbi:Major facilitator superfamily protein [Euphorbia peplus]|nr:Major facilitator superfamily protein [Euphorbia peplus]